jgi:hypothetical protein
MSDNSTKKARWTVMVYLAGDNNLTDECVHALTQIKEVDALQENGIHVLAQFDPKNSRLKSHRYELTHVSQHASLSADFKNWGRNEIEFQHPDYTEHPWWKRHSIEDVDDRNETNTGSPVTLFDFVAWCITQRPAECYLLIVSGHGGGTEKGYLLRDEHPDDALTIWELQVALEAMRERLNVHIDVLGMDCCLMTMAEVSFQLQGLADYLVGSEGYSPIAGWPLKPVLERMRDDLKNIPYNGPNDQERIEVERRAIAMGIVQEYVNYYLDYAIGGLSVDQSALRLSVAGNVKERIDALSIALRSQMRNPAFQRDIVWSHWRAQSYNGEQFVDLYDFCGLLRDECGNDTEIGKACQAILDTEPEFVPYSCYSGPTFQYSRGVSIYFPWAEIDPNYYAVRFAKRRSAQQRADGGEPPLVPSEWVEFLKEYIIQTRREQRDKKGPPAYGDNSYPYAARHTEGKHAPGKSMLPEVLSMRNPPISAGVSECIRAQDENERFLGALTQGAVGHPQSG